MGDLTKDFSLKEFLVSSKADALGIANDPTPEHRRRLREVTAPSLQKVRDFLGCAIVITSAYRNPTINAAVGGTPTSDHPQAWAVDCRAAGMSALAFARTVEREMRPGGAFEGMIDQAIYEASRSIVHLSFRPEPRGQVLTQRSGPGTPFEVGVQAA